MAAGADSGGGPEYLVCYPHGMRDVAEAELAAQQCCVTRSYPQHAAVLCTAPPGGSAELLSATWASRAIGRPEPIPAPASPDPGAAAPAAAADSRGGYSGGDAPVARPRKARERERCRGSTPESVAALVEGVNSVTRSSVHSNAEAWRAALARGVPWRAVSSGFPEGGGFGRNRVELCLAKAVSAACGGAPGGLGPVSLDTPEVRAVVRLCKAEAAGQRPLVALGVLQVGDAVRMMPLGADRATRSRAHDATAGCLALIASEVLQPALHLSGPVLVVDPMCGVGTLLLALRAQLRRMGVPDARVRLLGYDADPDAVTQARLNAERSAAECEFAAGDAAALPLPDGSASMVLTDPPWGQRHGTHHAVRKGQHHWCAEWCRVVAKGGAVLLVTIRIGQVERETLPWLRRRFEITEVGPRQFDNGGHPQCKLYRWTVHGRLPYDGGCGRPLYKGRAVCCDRCISEQGPHHGWCEARAKGSSPD
eukprot:TRINITY_DN32461_c0_g1_i4.p1 TRINITY_DN32461_c0_g1~~TRINITY_DN32461_c0_g1_i4.p1  ORF type:complete len:480 (+),score=68.22 TRINITY_DN32461_c0_g1_i4:91-1530(+)